MGQAAKGSCYGAHTKYLQPYIDTKQLFKWSTHSIYLMYNTPRARTARTPNLVMPVSCQECQQHSGGGQGTWGRQQGHSGGSCANLVRLCTTKAKHSIWAGWRTSKHCSRCRLQMICGCARARCCCPAPGQQPAAHKRPQQSLSRTVLSHWPALARAGWPQQKG